jgi:PhnB protein
MAEVGTYLNFKRETEAAFLFYRDVFGVEFEGAGIMRMGDAPAPDGAPAMDDGDKQLVMNVGLRIAGGHLLMGTDAPDSFGFNLTVGNNVYINVMPDTRSEADRLFVAFAEGGVVESPMAEMFWGDYWGSVKDKFGVQWMLTTNAPAGS